MDTESLFLSLKKQIVQTSAYQGVASFPDEVERMDHLKELVWWLGTTNFSSSRQGEYTALSDLSLIYARLDPSYARLLQLVSFIANLDTPGCFLGHERKPGVSPMSESISFHEATEAIASVVRGQAHLRKAMAQYIIFEQNLAGYDTLTLAQLAEQVEREYRWEFGDETFATSWRHLGNALAGTQTEQETLRQMVSRALEIGTRHIRSRLAINWLAQVHLRDASVQQELDRLKPMTLKAIWQQQMVDTTADPDFVRGLMRDDSFEDYRN
jgi:hypothetical protein